MNPIHLLLDAQNECNKVMYVTDESQISYTRAIAKLDRVIYYLTYGITKYYDRVYWMSTGDSI